MPGCGCGGKRNNPLGKSFNIPFKARSIKNVSNDSDEDEDNQSLDEENKAHERVPTNNISNKFKYMLKHNNEQLAKYNLEKIKNRIKK